MTRAAGALLGLLGLLAAAYSVWLFSGSNYDGGRYPVGGLMAALAVSCFVLAALLLRRR